MSSSSSAPLDKSGVFSSEPLGDRDRCECNDGLDLFEVGRLRGDWGDEVGRLPSVADIVEREEIEISCHGIIDELPQA